MSELAALKELLDLVVREPDADRALNFLIRTAREATRSRNALVAILDDETGQLEITHGAGPDWTAENEGKLMAVTIGNRQGITAYVAATGKSFVTGDVSQVPAYQHMFETTRSEMAVPIRDQYRKLKAVLNLEHDEKDHYGEDDVVVGEAIALVASMVLEREESWIREEALLEIGTAMDDARTMEGVLRKVIDVAGRVLRFQACSIFLFEPKSQQYVLRAATGALKGKVGELSYRGGEGFTGWVCEAGMPILLDHPQTDSRWRGKYTEFPSEEIASFLAVPIVVRGRSIGALRALRRVAENEYLDNRFTETDLRLFEAIAQQTAVALENISSLERLLHSERMAAWGELSAKSSHMIGNRVFALRGDVNELGHIVASENPSKDELKQIQQSLVTNVNRLQEILGDFRDFHTATQLERVPADINDLVRQTVSEVFPKRSKIDLHVSLDESIPSLEMDPKKVRLALSELIENAVSFMDTGRLEVSTAIADPEQIRLAKLPNSLEYAVITVQDTGPGVDADKKDAIFQPFFTSRVKGMGLGLSIVKGIADAHGGTAIEAGEPGHGAKFMLFLPLLERRNVEGA